MVRYIELSETCIKCGNNDFYILGNGKRKCRPCSKNNCKNYKKENKDMISKYNSEYKADHKMETRIYNRNYTKNRKKNDIIFKIKTTLRTRIYYALNGTKKCKTTLELLGCDYDFLRDWFEFQFDDSMNFTNHGSVWHIDHVIPCSKFNLNDPEEQKKCFHWSNLRPMNGIENIIKGNNINFNELSKHELVFAKYLLKNNNINFTIINYNKLNYLDDLNF